MKACAWWLTGLLFAGLASAQAFEVSVTIDFGPDRGQNFGSVFELIDRNGATIGGAGFMGAYNTQPRSSRRRLHFFIRPGTPIHTVDALPKPTTDAGAYLYDFGNRLHARSRNGSDNQLRFWDTESGQWRIDKGSVPYSTEVGDGVLVMTAKTLEWNGEPLVRVPEKRFSFAEYYYANGMIFVRLYDRTGEPPVNRFLAIPWQPGETADLSRAIPMDLRLAKEFAYALGQLDGKVVLATNSGGVYDFDGAAWRCLVEPDTKTSYQIYTILNYRDRLWMGHYPTGNLFEYDGNSVRHLAKAPPVWPGAVDRAREAQTLAIYGGEVYCGVWPWGEVWRFDESSKKWKAVRRMFTHPQVSGTYRHPYEEQMKQFGGTLNIWGQRITSMVPFGESLYISTSAKTSKAYDPKYSFLSDGRWQDYGKVYRLTKPGHLSVRTAWTGRPTRFEFAFDGRKMTVKQDGDFLGASLLPQKIKIGEEVEIRWGQGVFGSLRGEMMARRFGRSTID